MRSRAKAHHESWKNGSGRRVAGNRSCPGCWAYGDVSRDREGSQQRSRHSVGTSPCSRTQQAAAHGCGSGARGCISRRRAGGKHVVALALGGGGRPWLVGRAGGITRLVRRRRGCPGLDGRAAAAGAAATGEVEGSGFLGVWQVHRCRMCREGQAGCAVRAQDGTERHAQPAGQPHWAADSACWHTRRASCCSPSC